MNNLTTGFIRTKYYVTVVLMFLYALELKAQSTFLLDYNRSNPTNNKSDYLSQFPYNEYLKKISFTDFKQLETDRLFLNRHLECGNEFIYNLCDHYCNNEPISTENLEQKIIVGEKYLDARVNDADSISDTTNIYPVIGYFLLGKVSRKLEHDILNTTFDVRNPENKKHIARLADRKVFICTVPGNLTKAIVNFKKGNFKYVFLRTYLKLEDYFYVYYEKIGDGFLFVLFCLVSTILYLIWAGGKKRIYGILILISVILVHTIIKRKYEQPDLSILANPTISQQPAENYFYTNSIPAVRTYRLKNKQGNIIGESIWLTRKDATQEYVDAHYFAVGDIVSKYEQQKKDKSLILVSSGGFNNILEQPDGFTVEGGSIINTVISQYRHGMVMLHNGDINVLNLRNNHFTLPSGGKVIKNPLTSITAYAELVKWSQQAKATIFQTQLLCYQDSLLITIEKAKRELRERRLLAVCTDKKSNKSYYVIFNIRTPSYLAEITMEIFSVLTRNNVRIKAILNLDTGTYDILELWNDKGHATDAIKGTVDIHKAINLISFTKK